MADGTNWADESAEETEPKYADMMRRVGEFLDSRTEAVAQVLRAEVEPEAFISIAKTAITRNRDLLTCLPLTLWSCLYDAAKLGLDPDPRCGEFWLIPRWNSEIGQRECTGMIGYKGFIALGKRARVIESIETRCVYRDEVAGGHFKLSLGDNTLMHDWVPEEIDRSDDAIVAAYCRAWLPGESRPVIEPLTRAEIDKRMRASGTKIKAGRPWHDWFPEMARKSTVRALFGRGYFPLTARPRKDEKITIEAKNLTLADVLDRDDRWTDRRIELERGASVEVDPEAADTADTKTVVAVAKESPVADGVVVEEKPAATTEETVKHDLAISVALDKLVGDVAENREAARRWLEERIATYFGGAAWEQLTDPEKRVVLDTVRNGWAFEDLPFDDGKLPARLESVWKDIGSNAVAVNDIATDAGIEWDGTEHGLRKMPSDDLRRLIALVRRSKTA